MILQQSYLSHGIFALLTQWLQQNPNGLMFHNFMTFKISFRNVAISDPQPTVSV